MQKLLSLVVAYLSALPQTQSADGRHWNDSIAPSWGRDGVESLAAYVARELNITVDYAEALVYACAAANPDQFFVKWMKTKDGIYTDRQGNPVQTIALRRTGGSAPFVPGQTKFAPRSNGDATIKAAPAADAASL